MKMTLTNRFPIDSKAYRTDDQTIALLRQIMPSAKASGDSTAVAAVMFLGLDRGVIVEVPS